MIKQQLNRMILLLIIPFFFACEKIGNVPDVSQPIITQYVEEDTFTVGAEAITTGPQKDYEQGSDVVYKLTVASGLPLTKFRVKTTSDIFSSESKILKTEPENAIDSLGNFTQNVKDVVIYYSYHIAPLVPIGAAATVTFTFQNENNYVGTTTHTFNVIKQGSTSGKRLLVIDMPGNSLIPIAGIGSQDNLDNMSGTRTPGTGNGPYKKGPFYSLASRTDITYSSDALMNIPNIDFVGYRAKSAGISPLVLTNGEFYLVSPSDTTMLTSTYAGSTVTTIALVGSSGTANITVDGVTKTATYVTSTTQTATNFVTANAGAYSAAGYTLTSSAANLIWSAKNPNMGSKTGKIANVTGTLSGTQIRDEKNDLLASVIRQMTSSLPVGQTLKKVYFKRLDNITTDANQTRVTSTYFDQLTHDNEFDVLLNGIQAEGRTIAGPIGYNQVYGFVMEDGRRGLIKVTPSVIGTFPVSLPTVGNGVLYGSIKFQEN